MRAKFFVALAVLAASVAARPILAGSLTTMTQYGPPANRVNIVFLGDGYTADQIGAVYPAHLQAMLAHMLDGTQDPFPRYRKFFNVYRVNVVSNESGADVPPLGIYRDTALDASYYYDGVTERLLSINQAKAGAALSSALTGTGITADLKLVAVNDTRYGGAGGTYATYAGGSTSAPEIALHELGHSYGGLADEYYYVGTTYPGGEPPYANVTASSSGAKWSRWIGYIDPAHPELGAIGAYEGGMYYAKGIYRPSGNSKMRSLGRPFDAVSREQLILQIYNRVRPIDAALSNQATLADADYVWASVVDPGIIKRQWSVNGSAVSGATAGYFNPQLLAPGTYTLSLRAYDDTDWVRTSQEKLEQTMSWTVAVSGPVLAWDGDPSAGGLQDGGGDWGAGGAWYNSATAAAQGWDNAAPLKAILGVGQGTAGTIDLAEPVSAASITFNPAGSGSYALTGRTLTLVGAPTITANADAAIHGPIAGTSLTKAGAATLTLGGANSYSGPTTVSAGTLAVANASALPPGGDLVVIGAAKVGLASALGSAVQLGKLDLNGGSAAPTATLDLADNGLAADKRRVPGGVATIRAQIKAAYAGGAWTGSGIASSVAATDHAALGRNARCAVGYADNAVLGNTSFLGRAVDADAVLLRMTYYGDANLDGRVDLTDFGHVKQHYGGGDPGWSDGDFDYNGSVNLGDFGLMKQFFGSALTVSAAATAVAEPSAVAILAAAVLAIPLLRRRRGRG